MTQEEEVKMTPETNKTIYFDINIDVILNGGQNQIKNICYVFYIYVNNIYYTFHLL